MWILKLFILLKKNDENVLEHCRWTTDDIVTIKIKAELTFDTVDKQV